jgi:purine-nucleoside phosphorylase
MTRTKDQIDEAIAALRLKTHAKPQVALILGTGLGAVADQIAVESRVEYNQVPHMPVATAESHSGQFVFGNLGGKHVVAMKGRLHIYEGYTAQQVAFPVRVMRMLGAETMIVSNASGGMNRNYRSGDLMIIEDHVNCLGQSPLTGPNDDRIGPRWPDMIEPYDRALVELAELIAAEQRTRVHRGTYVAVPGPNLETRAEYRMLMQFADAVGMSTVPEVIAAVHCGMKTFGISVITDECIPDRLKPVSVPDIVRIAREAEPKLTRLMVELIQRM